MIDIDAIRTALLRGESLSPDTIRGLCDYAARLESDNEDLKSRVETLKGEWSDSCFEVSELMDEIDALKREPTQTGPPLLH